MTRGGTMGSVSDDAEFIAKAEQATGMSWQEIVWWGERQEFERQQFAKDRGYCCWAGAEAYPDPCAWHPSHLLDTGPG